MLRFLGLFLAFFSSRTERIWPFLVGGHAPFYLELAQQYFPQLSAMSAWRKFKEWLEYNPQLRHLHDLTRRTFTPAEVQLIYTQLGEP